jgi:hypothetical protein
VVAVAAAAEDAIRMERLKRPSTTTCCMSRISVWLSARMAVSAAVMPG